ncbi:DUF2913 family protein [Thalassotalea fonticola]|uniref:DUF2913 family protein n=1 Tax=Thalassotalea fonticola TaxID=3065649 RepID=A0ABZ0GIM3_9GAMM|nr:DUF2913 family protein [Colwelliaceae bacterium S1-1]
MNISKIKRDNELYNLVLTGLISLKFEQQFAKVSKLAAGETIYLGKWLKRAKKKKLFSKLLAGDIDNFLNLYAVKGRNAGLASVFNEIYVDYRTAKYVPRDHMLTPKSRFDNAMQTLSADGWSLKLPITEDFSRENPYRATSPKEIFTSDLLWNGAFNEAQELTKPLSIFMVSNPQEVIDCLYLNGFLLIKGISFYDQQRTSYNEYTLFPNNRCSGDIAKPSKMFN